MNNTDIIELVREHCPNLFKKIVMHEVSIDVDELRALVEHIENDCYEYAWNDGYREGAA